MQAGEGATGQLEAGLELGLDTISENQEVTFTRYVKLILPLDGFVYWVRGDLTDTPPTPATRAVRCSVHRTANENQVEDANYAVNRMVVTAQDEIDNFNEIAPTEMWLGSFEDIRFAFNASVMKYTRAGIWHYVGDAVYPFMDSQIIDSADQLDALALVVSNSLPIWLSLNEIAPVYPSFLVNDNIRPPYISAHIDPQGTQAIQASPRLGATMSHDQLASDRVHITMYGLNNSQALDYLDYILAFSIEGEDIGIMNMPIVRDEKRTQTELSIIAMKKTIEFEVSYYQSSVRAIARQFILSCIPTYMIAEP